MSAIGFGSHKLIEKFLPQIKAKLPMHRRSVSQKSESSDEEVQRESTITS